jgi:hypothetical protein
LNEISNQRIQRTAPLMRETLNSELRKCPRAVFLRATWPERRGGGLLSASKTRKRVYLETI